MKNATLIFLIFCFSKIYSQTFNKLIPLTHPMFGTSSIESCDFDLDGDKDILATARYGDELAWYENNGKGNYENLKVHTISNQLDGAIYVKTADFDKDGDQDVVCASADENMISWFQNLGKGVFGPKKIISNIVEKCINFQLADLNGDGFFEVIYSTYDSNALTSNLCLIKNNGNNIFSKPVLFKSFDYYSSATREVFDFDFDGDKDLLINLKNNIVILENDGIGNFSKTDTLVKNDDIKLVKIADINNDSIPDIIYSNSYKKINVILNYGNRKVSKPISLTNEIWDPTHIEVKDLNKDGYRDVIWTNNNIDISTLQVIMNKNGMFFENKKTVDNYLLTASGIIIEDIDSDGKNDIVVSTSKDSQIGWYKNIDSNSFSKIIMISSIDPSVNSVVCFDTDNDGDNDVVSLSAYNGKVSFYENNSNNGFLNQKIIHEFQNPLTHLFSGVEGDITTLDYNRDGKMDLLISYGYHSYNSANTPIEIQLFINKGGNIFKDSTFTSDNSNELLTGYDSKIKVADIDNDFDNDILFFYRNNKTLSVYINNGMNIYSKKNYPFNVKEFDLVDMNSDNYLDIVVGSGVLLNNKQGEFNEVKEFDSGIFSNYFTTIIDVDNDGIKDMVACIQDSNTFYWYKNINENFTPRKIIQKNIINVYQITSTDLNLDGFDDIIFRNSSGIYWLENLKNGKFKDKILLYNYSDYFILEDKDGDGDLDILFKSMIWAENQLTIKKSFVISVFIDKNKNKKKDKEENGLSNYPLVIQPSKSIIYTDKNGYSSYDLVEKIDALYKVELENTNTFSITTDSLNYSLNGLYNSIDTLLFGVSMNQSNNPIQTQLTSINQNCSGYITYQYLITNKSDKKYYFTTSILIDSSQILLNSSLKSDSTKKNHYVLSLDSILPFSTYSFALITKQKSQTKIDSAIISFKVKSTFDSNLIILDSNFTNRNCSSNLLQKFVSPKGYSTKGIIPQTEKWLTYSLTLNPPKNGFYGNEIQLIENVDTKLDISSFTFINSNFPIKIQLEKESKKLYFTIQKDFTKDSLNTLSIIYKFKINSNCKSGDSIISRTSIYFNTNSSQVSNSVINTIFDCNTLFKLKPIDTSLCLGAIIKSIPINYSIPVIQDWTLVLQNKIISSGKDLINYKSMDTGTFHLKLSVKTNICSIDTLVSNVRIENCATINSLDAFDFIEIYPIPTKDYLNFLLPENSDYKINIQDLSGKDLLSVYLMNTSYTSIDLSNFEPSIYFISVKNVKNSQHHKIKIIKI